MNLHVGQELWYVRSDNRRNHPNHAVTVTKIGRKWAYIALPSGHEYGRIDIESGAADAGNYESPGHCYLSEEDYLAAVALSEAWKVLQRTIQQRFRPPSGLNLADIEAATVMLHL